MYTPGHFAETRAEVLHALMRARPLATLVTLTHAGLSANHIPLLFFPPAPGEPGNGVLRGHVARANPVWRETDAGVDALAIFQGADSYVSPRWYQTKREHGKVVPTWNYCTVHVYGALRVHDDEAWVRALVTALTEAHEAGAAQPWAVTDAPEDYLQAMLRNIVGIELPIARIEGKWKVSQNQPEANRAGVISALEARGDDVARDMAELVRRHAPR